MPPDTNRNHEEMLGADTQQLVEQLFPEGKRALIITKRAGALQTTATETLREILPEDLIQNVRLETDGTGAFATSFGTTPETQQIGLIIAENGSNRVPGIRLASELRTFKDAGPEASEIPFVILRHSPSTEHVDRDHSTERFVRDRTVDAIISTPLGIEDLRIAIIESLLKVSGEFEALNSLAREKMLTQFTAMYERLMVAYDSLLAQFQNQEQVAGIRANFEAIQQALPGMMEKETTTQALREVRDNTEVLFSRLTTFRDRVARGKVNTKSYAVGDATGKYFEALTKMIERLLAVGSRIRAANHGHSSFSWYKALKTFGKERELTEYLNSRHAVKMLFDQCAILEKWAQQVEEFEVTVRPVDPKDAAATDMKKFFSNFTDGLWSIFEFAGMTKAQLLDMDAAEFSHHLNNRLAPLLSSMSVYNGEGTDKMEDSTYKAALNEDERHIFETLLANVQKFSEVVQLAKDNLKGRGNWDEFLKKLTDAASSYA